MRFLSCFCLCVIGAFAGTATQALTFRPTVYDDGYACPGNCDAHVAFRSEYNGTKYAFDPASSRNDPKPCVKGMQCRICFDDTDTSCLTVLYRGGGPAKLRFDFTPAFYAASCGKPELPAQVVAQCNSYAAQRVKLATGKLYCVSDAKDPKCLLLMACWPWSVPTTSSNFRR